jgi:hypothetical protein
MSDNGKLAIGTRVNSNKAAHLDAERSASDIETDDKHSVIDNALDVAALPDSRNGSVTDVTTADAPDGGLRAWCVVLGSYVYSCLK